MREALASLAKIHYGKSPSDVVVTDGQVPVVGTGGVYAKAGRALFDKGVVVARKGSLGTPHLMKEPFWPSDTTFAVIPSEGIDLEWLYFNLLGFDLTKLNEATGVPSISRDWLGKVRFVRPSSSQQQRIAAILTSLDNAIEATEALIEKHQQIKAGLMQDLFTRGVTPTGELRPPSFQESGLYEASALGLIPKSWLVSKLGDLVNPARPIAYGILMPGYGFPGGVPVVKVRDIRDRSIALDDLLLTSPQIDHEYRRSKLKPGDVLFTIRGTVGRIAVVPPELEGANITQDTARIDLVGVSGAFASYYFETPMAKRFFDVNTLGVAVQGINLGELRKLLVPIPPPSEQSHIVQLIAGAYKRIDAEMSLVRKLRAQKLGLMQDLLTGKVPVTVPEPALPA